MEKYHDDYTHHGLYHDDYTHHGLYHDDYMYEKVLRITHVEKHYGRLNCVTACACAHLRQYIRAMMTHRPCGHAGTTFRLVMRALVVHLCVVYWGELQ
ncbi:unnamed protein product [Brugia pahangi]|uniref:C2H2-type domain-containing protein n=1 Tax=Brugia pahangi TaxID=6280 RepID=A0A0N4TD41_BRUPA|nr:unnamed protein product [Brugia pahangi]